MLYDTIIGEDAIFNYCTYNLHRDFVLICKHVIGVFITPFYTFLYSLMWVSLAESS
jgi:hypothetical protein